MVNQTKQALEASLKHLLLQKPLDKITISDLTKDCGISRMAFYYHFKDIYDLVEWSCLEDATRALAGKKTYSTWTEGLLQIFEVVYENKPFIMNAYRCISREQIENFLFQLTSDLIMGLLKSRSRLRIRRYLIKISVLLQIFINTVLWVLCWTGLSRA